MERPNLTNVDLEVVAYIEALEAELEAMGEQERPSATPEPSEPPTTLNVITISQQNEAKRTPRHFYGRQRRGGMGVFDLETPEDEPARALVVADEADAFVLFSNFGRAFRWQVSM